MTQKMYLSKRICLLFILIFCAFFNAQKAQAAFMVYESELNWTQYPLYDNGEIKRMIWSFDYASDLSDYPRIPVYKKLIELPFKTNTEVEIDEVIIKNIGADEVFPDIELPSDFNVYQSYFEEGGSFYLRLEIVSKRKNGLNGQIEILKAFNINVKLKPEDEIENFTVNSRNSFNKRDTEKSVLSEGDWYKLSVKESGIYKIDYDLLKEIGFNPAEVRPDKISIFGNGGGMLPEDLRVDRYDDLQEIPLYVKSASNDRFSQGDIIYFYAEGPTKWTANLEQGVFEHTKHLYSDKTFYFISATEGEGKRIGSRSGNGSGQADVIIESFHDYAFHEKDLFNDAKRQIKSGRNWWGEEFGGGKPLTQHFEFDFPNRDESAEVIMQTSVAARSAPKSSFKYKINGSDIIQFEVDAVTKTYTSDYIKARTVDSEFMVSGEKLNVNITFIPGEQPARGWLDYIRFNVQRELRMNGSQMSFRNLTFAGKDTTALFRIQNANNRLSVWDVTNFHMVQEVEADYSSGTLSFSDQTTALREYVAFDSENVNLKPTFSSKIENQNLHALGAADYVIVAHPNFMEQARRLADFHRDYNNFKVHLVTPAEIYNEFSSGSQDVTAIRDFAKMIFDRSQNSDDHDFRYMLLFGDGSYDPKDRVSNNTNFIITYQSVPSIAFAGSFVSDDYFGILSNFYGSWNNAITLDVAVGRFPARTNSHARNLVDKVIHYHSPESFGTWRNRLTFVADDADLNSDGSISLDFTKDSEEIVNLIESNNRVYNMRKIYSDAHESKATPSGVRYPEVNRSIANNINEGTLLVNYIGHGGELGWAEQRILVIPDIDNWDNEDRLPIFITATCEFSRYDDPERISGGELVLHKERGGSIAMYSTTRLVWASQNQSLLRRMFTDNFFERDDAGIVRLGGINRRTKNREGFSSLSVKNLALLGDPATILALPRHKVVTTKINGDIVEEGVYDTINALQKVSVEGEIHDNSGNLLSDFNGTIYPSVYDKPVTFVTSKNQEYEYLESLIFRGKASVKGGKFEFSFYVPQDISYQEGFGKISYYAHSDVTDAHGYYDEIVFHGTNEDFDSDPGAPEVRLYMNDTSFRFGGLTGPNPTLLAVVEDDYGINMTGNSIGHDLIAELNGGRPIILNDHFEATLDSYQKGEIRYPLSDLPEGPHSVYVKVWNIANRSADAYTEFVVVKSDELTIEKIMNYPNPFWDKTNFSFEHNRFGEGLDISIEIFSIEGRHVATLNQQQSEVQTRVNNIEWEGDSHNGNKLDTGIYIYKVQIRDDNGDKTAGEGKLIITR